MLYPIRPHLEGMLWLTAFASFLLASMTSSKLTLILLGVAGVSSTLVVFPLHFFKAWRRLRYAPNRREYALWVGFETVCACAFFLSIIWAMHR